MFRDTLGPAHSSRPSQNLPPGRASILSELSLEELGWSGDEIHREVLSWPGDQDGHFVIKCVLVCACLGCVSDEDGLLPL